MGVKSVRRVQNSRGPPKVTKVTQTRINQMPFKPTSVRKYLDSEGTEHPSAESASQASLMALCVRMHAVGDGEFHGAVIGECPEVAADILTLASLLRPPRAKRKGQSDAPFANTSGTSGSANAGNLSAATAENARADFVHAEAAEASPSPAASVQTADGHAAIPPEPPIVGHHVIRRGGAKGRPEQAGRA